MASPRGLTTKEAAEKLGVTMRWVQALIKDRRLPAEKVGRDYFISEADLRLVSGLKPGPKPKQVVALGGKRGRRKRT
jgi:excisionase family DNA binding protein